MICEALDDFSVAVAVAPLLHLAQEVARLLTGAPFRLLRAFAVARERRAAVPAEGAADQGAGAVAETAGQRVRLIRSNFRRASGGEQQRADPNEGARAQRLLPTLQPDVVHGASDCRRGLGLAHGFGAFAAFCVLTAGGRLCAVAAAALGAVLGRRTAASRGECRALRRRGRGARIQAHRTDNKR